MLLFVACIGLVMNIKGDDEQDYDNQTSFAGAYDQQDWKCLEVNSFLRGSAFIIIHPKMVVDPSNLARKLLEFDFVVGRLFRKN